MKLVFSIVHHDDAQTVTQTLTKSGFTSTRLSTSGGFLMARNITLMIGVDEGKVQTVIDIIRDCCHSRKELISPSEDVNYGYYPTMPVEVVVGGATIFVIDVERFEHV